MIISTYILGLIVSMYLSRRNIQRSTNNTIRKVIFVITCLSV